MSNILNLLRHRCKLIAPRRSAHYAASCICAATHSLKVLKSSLTVSNRTRSGIEIVWAG